MKIRIAVTLVVLGSLYIHAVEKEKHEQKEAYLGETLCNSFPLILKSRTSDVPEYRELN